MIPLPLLAYDRPEFLFLLILLPLFWLWQRRAFRSLASFFSLLLHSLVFALLVLAAAGIHQLLPGTARTPVLVLDLSRSVTAAQRQWMRNTIEERLHPTSDTPVVVFAGGHERMSWHEAEPLLAAPPAELRLEETNLESVLTNVLKEAANQNIYLLSDGWETKGEVRSILPLLGERQLHVYPFPLPPAAAVPNVGIQRLGAPPSTTGGETVEVSVALENTHPTAVRGELILRQEDKVFWQQSVALAPGVSLLTHPLVFADSGLIPLRATFTPDAAQDDATPQDNQATAWVSVTPTEKVLLLSDRAQDNRYLEKVLKGRGLGVTVLDWSAARKVWDWADTKARRWRRPCQ